MENCQIGLFVCFCYNKIKKVALAGRPPAPVVRGPQVETDDL